MRIIDVQSSKTIKLNKKVLMHEKENKDARIIYDPQPKNLHTVMGP